MKSKSVHYTLWQIGPGGMELGVKHYSERFSQHRKLYAYGLRPTGQQIFDESKIEVKVGSGGRMKPYLQYFRYCRRYNNDIFHLQNGGPLVLILTLLAGVNNIVYHIHGTIYWKTAFQKVYLKTAWLVVRLLLPFSKTTFIANSKYSANIFREKVLPVSLVVIYNGLEVPKFSAKKWLRTDLKRIGFAGRLAVGKNVHQVIRLFDEIAEKCPDVELHIAGDGILRPALEEQAQKSPYAKRILFHGHVQDIPSFYASMDMFLFLSAYESFGNVIAEALLTGLPTLTSNVPVFEEIYGHEQGFILGDPKNYEQTKQKFLKAIADFPHLARKA
ncbi:MAG TPA: glycosyltransferase family 4 protein, partial [Saprospiraceae bacterium]|nr:glycosyltransferase family 4 protein [Saprospiraceae bacterium]